MVFIKLTAQEKHTRRHSKYEILAHGLDTIVHFPPEQYICSKYENY